jgi:hypothetical protein
MDQGFLFLLFLLPIAITGIITVKMMEKNMIKGERVHESYLEKSSTDAEVTTLNRFKKQ